MSCDIFDGGSKIACWYRIPSPNELNKQNRIAYPSQSRSKLVIPQTRHHPNLTRTPGGKKSAGYAPICRTKCRSQYCDNKTPQSVGLAGHKTEQKRCALMVFKFTSYSEGMGKGRGGETTQRHPQCGNTPRVPHRRSKSKNAAYNNIVSVEKNLLLSICLASKG